MSIFSEEISQLIFHMLMYSILTFVVLSIIIVILGFIFEIYHNYRYNKLWARKTLGQDYAEMRKAFERILEESNPKA